MKSENACLIWDTIVKSGLMRSKVKKQASYEINPINPRKHLADTRDRDPGHPN